MTPWMLWQLFSMMNQQQNPWMGQGMPQVNPLPVNTSLPQAPGQGTPAPGAAPPQQMTGQSAPVAPGAAPTIPFSQLLQQMYPGMSGWTQAGNLMNAGPKGNFQNVGNPALGTEWTAGSGPGQAFVAGPSSMNAQVPTPPQITNDSRERESR